MKIPKYNIGNIVVCTLDTNGCSINCKGKVQSSEESPLQYINVEIIGEPISEDKKSGYDSFYVTLVENIKLASWQIGKNDLVCRKLDKKWLGKRGWFVAEEAIIKLAGEKIRCKQCKR